MRLVLAIVLSSFLTGAERDPVRLRVTINNGWLSYEIVNNTPYRIVSWQAFTRYTSGGYEALECGVSAQVKRSSDLMLRDRCSLPNDDATGKPVTVVSRIAEVKFANGLKYIPHDAEQTPQPSVNGEVRG